MRKLKMFFITLIIISLFTGSLVYSSDLVEKANNAIDQNVSDDSVAINYWQNKCREISMEIATWLLNYGKNPFTDDGKQEEGYPGHYRIRKKLRDNRVLDFYFCNINNRPIDNVMSNSRLELRLFPNSDDQIGYSVWEYGLTGRFESIRIYEGFQVDFANSSDPLNDWFHIYRESISSDAQLYFEEKYYNLLQQFKQMLIYDNGTYLSVNNE